MIAAVHSTDLGPLFTILAVAAFGVAIWLTVRAQYVGALVAAVIGVLLLIYAA